MNYKIIHLFRSDSICGEIAIDDGGVHLEGGATSILADVCAVW